MGKTTIAWTNHTTNPIRFRNKETGKIGHWCEKISAGCRFCYASRQQSPYLSGLEYKAENRDKGELFFEPKALQEVLRRRIPTKYFWCDMTDLFGSWVPDEWIDRCLATMALTPWHTHQILTKREERMREHINGHQHGRMCDIAQTIPGGVHGGAPFPLPNVWLGVSCENQAAADARIPLLLQTPAAVRWVSIEPMLGPVDLRNVNVAEMVTSQLVAWRESRGETVTQESRSNYPSYCSVDALTGDNDHDDLWTHLDWVVTGGESGPAARPCNIEWIRSIVRQCAAAGTRCFVKQMGSYAILDQRYDRSIPGWTRRLADRKGADPEEWPEDLRVRQMPEASE